MPTQRKVEQVAEIRALITGADIAISASYQGISTSAQEELRNAVRATGGQVRVVKNTLLRIAADEAGMSQFGELADGPTAIIVGRGDIVASAKAVTEYIRTHDNTPVTIRKAVVNGELVDADYVRDLATVPPREELLGRIAGGLVGKITELVLLLQSAQQEFAGLIEARAKQLEEGGATADAPAAEATEEAPAAEATEDAPAAEATEDTPAGGAETSESSDEEKPAAE